MSELKLKQLQNTKWERCMDVPMTTVPTCQSYQEMIFSAYRYALGRHTYIVKDTVDYICSNIKVFDHKWLNLMREETKRYLDEYYADPDNSPEFECDVKRWEQLYNVVVERLMELT